MPQKNKKNLSKFAMITAFALSTTLILAGCVTPEGTTSESKNLKGKKVDLSKVDDAKGDVVVCGGNDASKLMSTTTSEGAKETGLNVKYIQLAKDATTTRTQMVQRLEGKSEECDVYMIDVIWTPEFASQEWLYDQTEVVKKRLDEIIPSTAETTHYDDKYWSTPFTTNAALIFSRTDKVTVPATWQDLYKEATKPDSQYLYQGSSYEGLTCVFLEMLYSAGGEIVDSDGKVKVDSPETREVLELMAKGIETGAADKAVTTYMEDDARLAFESGVGGFERNWPYAYALMQKTDLKDKVEVSPLPSWEGKKASGVLGGSNMAISAYSKNPEAAMKFINFATAEEWQDTIAMKFSSAPVMKSSYTDPKVIEAMPFAAELYESLVNAKPRPQSPNYAAVSRAVYEGVFSVLSGQATPDDATTKMASEVKKAQDTF